MTSAGRPPSPGGSPPRRRPPARRAATLAALLAGAALAAGCSSSRPGPGPRPIAVLPDSGSLEARVAIRIRGEAFETRVTGDLAGPGEGTVDTGYRALLGTVALEDVALRSTGELTATVPAGLASGLYDLTVIDPWGRSGALARAYRVLVPERSGASVAGYRIDPLGPQEAFRPFMAAIVAVDAAGAVATGFNGSVRVADLTGTGVPGSAARFVAGRWSGLVEVRAAHPADVLTVLDAQGTTGASAPFTVAPPRPAAVRFATPPIAAAAGQCAGPITLALDDAFGVPAQADRATTLTLAAAPSDGFTVHGDAGCATPGDTAVVAAGQGAVSVWIVATRAGALDLTAAGAGLTPAVQREAVAAGPPATLAFVTAPQAVNTGACSMPATVEVRDAHGNPSPPGALALTLEAAPASGLGFFADASCSGAISSVTLGAGATRAGFHFSGTTAQVVRVTVAGSGLASASQDVLVTAQGGATRLVFLSAPRGAAAGACSEEVTVQALDSHGNAVAAPGAVQVRLSASPAAGFATYADAACSVAAGIIRIGAGQSTGGFHFRGTLAASVTVAASSATLTGATQTETVGPAPPAQVTFASGAQTAPAGGCSAAVTLQVRDAFGNASPVGAPLPVGLSAVPEAGFAFFADPACTQPLSTVTVGAGASAAGFHFKGTQAGSVVVSARPDGLPGDTQTEQVRAAAATHLAFTSGPQTVAAGACSAAAALEVRDAAGNVAALPGGAMVHLAATPPAGVAFFRDAGCSVPVSAVAIPAAGSTASLHFSATTAGPVTVTASAAGLEPGTQVETVVAALPMQLAFSSAAQTVAAGDCSAPVTVETRDALGNPSAVPGAASVTLTASPPAGLALFAGAGCSGAAISAVPLPAGASAATFSFRGTSAGPITLTAASPALGAATQLETVRPAAPDRVAFETAPQSVAVGGCSGAVTVRAEDPHGNPSSVAVATPLALGAVPAGLTFHSDAACTTAVTSVTIPAGAASASFRFKGAAAGSFTVTATPSGLGAASQVETLGGSGPDHLAFTTAAQRVAAGDCSAAVVLQALDAGGSAAAVSAPLGIALSASPAAGLSFFAGAGCAGAPVSTITLGAAASTATFSFRATDAGTVTLSASAAGLSPSPTQAETVDPGPLHHFAWGTVASPQASAVPFPVTVIACDAWGNVVSSFTGSAALSVSAGAVACSSSCTSGRLTGGFMAGVWTGSVAVSPQGTGVTLAASSGSATGTSAAFDVSGPATRSPPTARLAVTPTVLVSGNDIHLDASGSSDYQTPAAELSVSWDFEGTAASMDDAPAPPAQPWTAWSRTKTANHALINHGAAPLVFHPRVAVADTETGTGGPDVAYASATVVVLPNGDAHCTVDTASDTDDGATSCHAKGSDGKLSLREALRLANAARTPIAVEFGGPMTITFSGALAVSRPVFIVARPGVAIDTGTLSISASGVLIAGLELSRQGSPVVVQPGGDVTFRDVALHDGAGLVVRGRARLDRVRMSGCAGTCIQVDDGGAWLALHDSELRGSRTNTGLALTACASGGWGTGTLASPFQPYAAPVLVAGTVFSGFATAVESSCATAVLTNDTFAGNGVGVHGVGLALLDGVFSGQTTSAVSASSCPGFVTSRRHLVWQNASDGCLAAEVAASPMADLTFSADPLYIAPASGDFRIQRGSPARDQGSGTSNVDLDSAGPGRWLGADADRGGRETY